MQECDRKGREGLTLISPVTVLFLAVAYVNLVT